MLKKLRDKVKINNEFNTGNFIAAAAIMLTVVGFEMKQTEQVATNTSQIKSMKEMQVRIVEDQRMAAVERKEQAVAMSDMAKLIDEIRRKLDLR